MVFSWYHSLKFSSSSLPHCSLWQSLMPLVSDCLYSASFLTVGKESLLKDLWHQSFLPHLNQFYCHQGGFDWPMNGFKAVVRSYWPVMAEECLRRFRWMWVYLFFIRIYFPTVIIESIELMKGLRLVPPLSLVSEFVMNLTIFIKETILSIVLRLA